MNDELICYCMKVTRQQITDALEQNNFKTPEEVEENTEAGSGCGICYEDIEELIAVHYKERG